MKVVRHTEFTTSLYCIFLVLSFYTLFGCTKEVSTCDRADCSGAAVTNSPIHLYNNLCNTVDADVSCKDNNPYSDASDISGVYEELNSMGITEAEAEINPFARNLRLGRGVNLANALEAPQEGDWGVVLKESYFQRIAEAGFDSVRVPIRWSGHAEPEAPYTIDEDFFARVDWVIEQARSRNLAVVINMHNYDEMMEQPVEHKERFLGLWDQIAFHYQAFDDDLYFEVLNEPNTNLSPDIWNDYLHEALAIIRKSNPTRTIIIGVAMWGDLVALNDLVLPDDEQNVIVTIHYYRPFEFTHQGAEWIENSNRWLKTRWRRTWRQLRAVENDFNSIQIWSEDNLRPIFLGEFGAYFKADLKSRLLWTQTIRRQAEDMEFSWAYWDFAAGFGVFDPEVEDWNYSLLGVLLD